MGSFSITGSGGVPVKYDNWGLPDKLPAAVSGESAATSNARKLSDTVTRTLRAFGQQRTPSNYKKLAATQAELRAATAGGGRARPDFEPRLTTGAPFDSAAIDPQALQQANATLKGAAAVLKEYEVGHVQYAGKTGFAGQQAKSPEQWSTELSVQQAWVPKVSASGIIEERSMGFVVTHATLKNPQFGDVEGESTSSGFTRPIKNLPILGAQSMDQALSMARTKVNSGEWSGERMIMMSGVGKPIEKMNGFDKLLYALQAGAATAGPAIQQELMSMFTPAGMAQLAGFAAASSVPVLGQILDAGMFAMLLVKLGPEAGKFVKGVWDAVHAKSFTELQKAGDQMSGMIKEAVVQGAQLVGMKGAAKLVPKHAGNVIHNKTAPAVKGVVKTVKAKAPKLAKAIDTVGKHPAANLIPGARKAKEVLGELEINGGIRPNPPKATTEVSINQARRALPGLSDVARSAAEAKAPSKSENPKKSAVKAGGPVAKVEVNPKLASLLDETRAFSSAGDWRAPSGETLSPQQTRARAKAMTTKSGGSSDQRRVDANARSQIDWRSTVKQTLTELDNIISSPASPQPAKIKARVVQLQKKLDGMQSRAERNGWTVDAGQIKGAKAALQRPIEAFSGAAGIKAESVPPPVNGAKASSGADGVSNYVALAQRSGEIFGVRENGKIDVAVREALFKRLEGGAQSDGITVEETLRRWGHATPKQRASEFAASVIEARKSDSLNGVGNAEAATLLDAARSKIKDINTSDQAANDFVKRLLKFDGWNEFYQGHIGGAGDGGGRNPDSLVSAGGGGRGPNNPKGTATAAEAQPASDPTRAPTPAASEVLMDPAKPLDPKPSIDPATKLNPLPEAPRAVASNGDGAKEVPRGVQKELNTRYGKGNWSAQSRADGGGGFDIYSSGGGRGGRRLPAGPANAGGRGDGSRKLGELSFDGSDRTKRGVFSPESNLAGDRFAVSLGGNRPVAGLFISDRIEGIGSALDGAAALPRRPTAWIDKQIKRLGQVRVIKGGLALGEAGANLVTSTVFDRLVKLRDDAIQASGERLGSPLRKLDSSVRGGKYTNQVKKAIAERDKLVTSSEKVIDASTTKLAMAVERKSTLESLNRKLKLVEQKIADVEASGRVPDARYVELYNRLRKLMFNEARAGAQELVAPTLDKVNASIKKWEKKVAGFTKAIESRQADYDRALQSSMGIDTAQVITARKRLTEAKSELNGHEAVDRLKQELHNEQMKTPGQETDAVLDARRAYEEAKQTLKGREPSADHPEFEAMFDRELGIEGQLAVMKERAKALEALSAGRFVTPAAYDVAARDAQLSADSSNQKVDKSGYGDAVINHFDQLKSMLETDSLAAVDKHARLLDSQLVVSADGVVTQRSVDASASNGALGSLVNRVGHSHSKLKALSKRIDDLGNTKKVSAAESELTQVKEQIHQTEQLLTDLRQARQTAGEIGSPQIRQHLFNKAEGMLKAARKKAEVLESRVSLEQRAAEPGQMNGTLRELQREVDINKGLLEETRAIHKNTQRDLRRKIASQSEIVDTLQQQRAAQPSAADSDNRSRPWKQIIDSERAKLRNFQDEFAANDAAFNLAIQISNKSDAILSKSQNAVIAAQGVRGYTPGKMARGALRAVSLYSTAALGYTGVQLATGNVSVLSKPAEVQLMLKQLNLAPLSTTGGLPEIQIDTTTGRFAAKLTTGWVVGYRVRGDLADAMVVAQLGPQSRGAIVGAFMGGKFDSALSNIFQPGKLGSLSPSIQKGTSGMYLTVDSEKIALATVTVATLAKLGSTAVSYQNIWKIEAAPIGVSARLNTGGTNPTTGAKGLMGEIALSHGTQIPFKGFKLGKTGLSIPSFLSPPIVGGLAFTQSTRINVGMLSMIYDPNSGVGTVTTRDANYALKVDRNLKPIGENNQFTQPYGQAGLVYFRLEPNYYGLYDADNYVPGSNGYEAMKHSRIPKALFDTLTFKAFIDPQQVWDTATEAPKIPKDMPKATP